MSRTARIAAACAFLLLAGCGGDDDGGDVEAPAETGYLTVLQASGGSIEGDGSALELTLRDVAPEVTAFSERPERVAGTVPTDDYVGTWANEYEGDPPNAALSVNADGEATTLAVELDPPQRSGDDLTFRARQIEDPGDALDSPAVVGGDEGLPSRFDAASLFVDDGGLMQLVAYGAQDV